MTQKLNAALEALSDRDFEELDLRLKLAKQARAIRDRFLLTDAQCCELLDIAPGQLQAYLNGAHEFTIRDMATHQVVYQQLETERTAKDIAQQTKELVHVTGLDG